MINKSTKNHDHKATTPQLQLIYTRTPSTPVEKELDRLADAETVKSFIAYECMMPKYCKRFFKNGFVSMYKIVNELNKESLDKMDITSRWERLIILLKVRKYKQKMVHKP